MLHLIIFIHLLFSQPGQEGEILQTLRTNYPSAVQSQQICKAALTTIDSLATPSSIESAYIGAYYAVWASHTSAPIDKLRSFKKGKSFLERAVKQDPENAEIRFLRLTIQYNAPGILQYKNAIEEDLQTVLESYNGLSSEIIKGMIKDFLLSTDLLSEAQRKHL